MVCHVQGEVADMEQARTPDVQRPGHRHVVGQGVRAIALSRHPWQQALHRSQSSAVLVRGMRSIRRDGTQTTHEAVPEEAPRQVGGRRNAWAAKGAEVWPSPQNHAADPAPHPDQDVGGRASEPPSPSPCRPAPARPSAHRRWHSPHRSFPATRSPKRGTKAQACTSRAAEAKASEAGNRNQWEKEKA